MSLISDLTAVVATAFETAGFDPARGEVVPSQRPELAQFQCNGALSTARAADESPRDVAGAVAAALAGHDAFVEVAIAGPGFINLTLTDGYLAGYMQELVTAPRLAVAEQESQTIVVDYGGPNVAKELHVGHLRTAIIGESLKRLLRFLGHNVLGDVHLGDWGMPMGQLIIELGEREPALPYFDTAYAGPYPTESPVTIEDLQVMYPVAAASAKDNAEFVARAARAVVELHEGRPGYRALWQHFRDVSVDAIAAVYDELGVHFDLWYGESTINDRLAPMLERLQDNGTAVESDGALVVEVALPEDTKEIPPMLLRKSDGATLYTTWDVATIEDRIESLGAEVMIYVVDSRQALHFEQVFRTARKARIAGPDVVLEHAGNGTVNGPDGRPFKTRDGDLLRLRDLISMVIDRAAERLDENQIAAFYPDAERREISRKVGLAALKYGDLRNHRTSDYTFDLERFTSFEGKTGPYLLYGTVRMRSILARAEELGLKGGDIMAPSADVERNLMLRLSLLPEVVVRAGRFRAPNHLAEYAYELVADFSRFYEACHVLREEDAARQASWLSLVDVTLREVSLLLDLLIIEVPERM